MTVKEYTHRDGRMRTAILTLGKQSLKLQGISTLISKNRDIPFRISLTESIGDRRVWPLHRDSASRVRIATLSTFCTEARRPLAGQLTVQGRKAKATAAIRTRFSPTNLRGTSTSMTMTMGGSLPRGATAIACLCAVTVDGALPNTVALQMSSDLVAGYIL